MGKLRNQRCKSEGTFLESVKNALTRLHEEIASIKGSIDTLRVQSHIVSSFDVSSSYPQTASLSAWDCYDYWNNGLSPQFVGGHDATRSWNVLAKEFAPSHSIVVPRATLLAYRDVGNPGKPVIQAISLDATSQNAVLEASPLKFWQKPSVATWHHHMVGSPATTSCATTSLAHSSCSSVDALSTNKVGVSDLNDNNFDENPQLAEATPTSSLSSERAYSGTKRVSVLASLRRMGTPRPYLEPFPGHNPVSSKRPHRHRKRVGAPTSVRMKDPDEDAVLDEAFQLARRERAAMRIQQHWKQYHCKCAGAQKPQGNSLGSPRDVLVSRLDSVLEVLKCIEGRAPQAHFSELCNYAKDTVSWMRAARRPEELRDKVEELDAYMFRFTARSRA